jgi:hypothetical protein
LIGKANRSYEPKPEDKFSFGLWTLGNRGRDPFGDAVPRTMPPVEIVSVLGEIFDSQRKVCSLECQRRNSGHSQGNFR